MTPTLSPDQMEAVARAAYEDWIAPVRDLEPSWDDLPRSHIDRLVDCQRAALDAALPVIIGAVLERAADVFGAYIDDIYVRDGFCDWADVATARDSAILALAEDTRP